VAYSLFKLARCIALRRYGELDLLEEECLEVAEWMVEAANHCGTRDNWRYAIQESRAFKESVMARGAIDSITGVLLTLANEGSTDRVYADMVEIILTAVGDTSARRPRQPEVMAARVYEALLKPVPMGQTIQPEVKEILGLVECELCEARANHSQLYEQMMRCTE